MTSAQKKKCAHLPCSCPARDGSDYCSVECEAMERAPEAGCKCHHQGCKGHTK